MRKSIALITGIAVVVFFSFYPIDEAEAAIGIGNVSNSGEVNSVDPVTWTHTTTAGNNLVLIVCIAMDTGVDASRVVNTVTYNGDSMTKIRETDNAADNVTISMWELINPDVGSSLTISADVVGTLGAAVGMAVTLTGADQTNPSEADNGSIATNNTATTVSVTTLSPQAVVVDCNAESASSNLTADASQSPQADVDGVLMSAGMSTETKASPGAVSMDWTSPSSASDWAHNAVAIRPLAFPLIPQAF